MPRKRSARFSNFKDADWDKYIQVKKGAAEYNVERAATPEQRERFRVGVTPFGVSPPTTAPFHHPVTMTRLAVQIATAVMGGTWENTFGVEPGEAAVGEIVKGGLYYPALAHIAVVAAGDTGRENTTSQLSTRKYRKYRTRQGSVPFGRRPNVPGITEGTNVADRAAVDYRDMTGFISEEIGGATLSGIKVKTVSFEPEVFVMPISANLKWLDDAGAAGSIVF